MKIEKFFGNRRNAMNNEDFPYITHITHSRVKTNTPFVSRIPSFSLSIRIAYAKGVVESRVVLVIPRLYISKDVPTFFFRDTL